MSDELQNQCKECKELTDKLHKLEGTNRKLMAKNYKVSQSQWPAICAYSGVVVVSILSGLSVVFLDSVDKPRAVVLVVNMLCWTGLATIALLFFIRTKEEADRD